jgi:hypothetical protein
MRMNVNGSSHILSLPRRSSDAKPMLWHRREIVSGLRLSKPEILCLTWVAFRQKMEEYGRCYG